MLNSTAARLATRLSFFVAGFGLAAWAPLVPLIKQSLQLDDGMLGMLLLCLGFGSITAMVGTGALSARYGAKVVIMVSGFLLALTLPMLAVADSLQTLAMTLVVFGAALGSMDVAINLYATVVERAANKPMMSGFHAMFSVGGFAGSALMTLLLSVKAGALSCTLVATTLMLVAMVIVWPRLTNTGGGGGAPLLAIPRGVVLILAILAGIAFLVEGAILDWGGVLLTDAGLVETAHGGSGYICFSIAMLAGRFSGDSVTARFGDGTVLFWSGVAAIVGIVTVLVAPIAWIALAGFFLIGAGGANIVPILFRLAGKQQAMPSGLAVAAISTIGYAGVLIGPASIGFVAKHMGLAVSFGMLAALLCAVPALAAWVTHRSTVAGEGV